jgi:hypothetical protein
MSFKYFIGTPWTGFAYRNNTNRKEREQIFKPRVGFENTIQMFERSKTLCVLRPHGYRNWRLKFCTKKNIYRRIFVPEAPDRILRQLQ